MKDANSADSVFSDAWSASLKSKEIVSEESSEKLRKRGSAMANEGPAQWFMERQPQIVREEILAYIKS